MGTFDYFQFFIINYKKFLIISETTIISVNGYDCSLSNLIGVSDIITNCRVENSKIIVDTLTSGTFEF